jgi:hypothetical protein
MQLNMAMPRGTKETIKLGRAQCCNRDISGNFQKYKTDPTGLVSI